MRSSEDILIARSLHELDFRQLMDVYEQTIRQTGRESYPHVPEPQQMLMAEQDFYAYLKECFFTGSQVYYAVWAPEGRYRAAARLEPYRDGYLLAALETAPESRRKGHGSDMLNQVMRFLSKNNCSKLYSHIDKKNTASLALHAACGFCKTSDHAVLLDGSVLSSYYTYCCVL